MTSEGLVRAHGPVSNRCAGSNNRPAPPDTGDSSSQSTVSVAVTSPTSNSEPPSSQFSLRQVPQVRILKRIPRASREQSLKKLASILEGVVSSNCPRAWERLFHLSARCLRVPARSGRRWSLATMINKQLREEEDPPAAKNQPKKRQSTSKDPLESLGRRVSSKLEDGDFKGAVRLACSEDSLAERSEATYSALKEKHPAAHPVSTIPPPPDCPSLSFVVSEGDVANAVRSFPNGSAGGPDGLRPQHLKDMVSSANGEDSPLLTALAAFSTLVLEGKTPQSIRPYFFGASLVALEKKGGGVRPIAVGCTLRRLVAKIAGNKIVGDMADLLAPRQLGYGVIGGAEAAVHATRQYLCDLQPDHARTSGMLLTLCAGTRCLLLYSFWPLTYTLLSTPPTQLHQLFSGETGLYNQKRVCSKVIPWALFYFAYPFMAHVLSCQPSSVLCIWMISLLVVRLRTSCMTWAS